jgi:hypothetical protein
MQSKFIHQIHHLCFSYPFILFSCSRSLALTNTLSDEQQVSFFSAIERSSLFSLPYVRAFAQLYSLARLIFYWMKLERLLFFSLMKNEKKNFRICLCAAYWYATLLFSPARLFVTNGGVICVGERNELNFSFEHCTPCAIMKRVHVIVANFVPLNSSLLCRK